MCSVFDSEESEPQESYPGGKREKAPAHMLFLFLLFLVFFCPTNSHTAFSICTSLSTLSLSCPLKPEVTRGQGRYHIVRGALEEERGPFFSLVSVFHLCTAVILDGFCQKTLCQRVVRPCTRYGQRSEKFPGSRCWIYCAWMRV